jgi:hypothetical protein
MIDRGISAGASDILLRDETAVIAFIDLDWPSGRVLAHSGLGDRVFQGQTYLGVGEFGGISEIDEASGNSPNQLSLSIRFTDPTLVNTILNESPEGREVSVHLAALNDKRIIVEEIPYIFDGNVAKGSLRRGDIAKNIPYQINITCSDWFERWSQPPNNARTTDNAQQHLHPGDRIFDLTEVIAGSPLHTLPSKNNRAAIGGAGRGRGRRNEPSVEP